MLIFVPRTTANISAGENIAFAILHRCDSQLSVEGLQVSPSIQAIMEG
jgi:hypothetical protein